MTSQSRLLQTLVNDLASPDVSTREEAAHALHDIGEAARSTVPALLDALVREPDACPWIGTAIVALSPCPTDIDAIRTALHSENDHVRFWAARAAVKLGADGQPLVTDLIRLMCDPHHTVTDSVIWALGAIGESAISPLVEAATGNNSERRAQAVIALGSHKEHTSLKIPVIIDALNDPVQEVRNKASRALCSMGQFAHLDPSVIAPETRSQLLSALIRIEKDPSIDIDSDWLQRVLGWLRTDE